MSSSNKINYFPDCTSLSETDIRLYSNYIHTWITHLPKEVQDIHFLLMFPKKSLTYLPYTDKYIYVSAIIALINHSPTVTKDIPYRYELEKQWNSLQIHIDKLPVHQNITIDQIIAYRDTLSDGSIEKLLISMYTMIPPVSADYFATEIVEYNNISAGQDMIRFTNSDMSKCGLILSSKDIYHHNLPKLLVNQIKQSLVILPRRYLFIRDDGKPYTQAIFHMWANNVLSRCFKVQMTLSLFTDIILNIHAKYRWTV